MEGYTLNVERKVVVQEGLCVLVPCNFSYPKDLKTDSSPVYGYWFQKGANIKNDQPVATNNPKRPAQERTQHRFFLLLGDQQKNDCSLNIREIEKEDAGTYVFRLERGKTKFSYRLNMMTLNVTGQT